MKYCLNTETGVVRPNTGDINDDLALAINPRGSSNNVNTVLERQLARQQVRLLHSRLHFINSDMLLTRAFLIHKDTAQTTQTPHFSLCLPGITMASMLGIKIPYAIKTEYMARIPLVIDISCP